MPHKGSKSSYYRGCKCDGCYVAYLDYKDSSKGKSTIKLRTRLYGVDKAAYSALEWEQSSRCKICGRHKDNFKKGLAVDHNHRTGKVRGLLCYPCNLILGYAKDNPVVLLKAIKYLKDNQ